MRSDWISHDGSDRPPELDRHHRVDIETAVGFMNAVRADKVNWKNVTAWRLCPDASKRTTPEDSGPHSPTSDAASAALEGGKAMHNTLDKYFSVQETLNERASRYGDIETLMTLSQDIQQAMRGSKNWWELMPAQREALQMIASKIARILNGDPNYKDNWHDIQGYARLAEERCRESSQ